MTGLGLAVLAVAPALGLTVYFYLRDRYEPEPRGLVAVAFGYGLLVLVPALWLGARVRGAVSAEWLALSGIWGRLYEDFLVAGAVEEGLKAALFWATIARWREFDEPMDGLVYGAAMALGLAAVENLYYVLGCRRTPGCAALSLALLRGVLAVPAHALCGAAMGYFVGRVKFVRVRAHRVYLVPASLLVPWAFHGAYDHLASYAGQAAGWASLGAVSLGMWGFVLWAIARALGRSPFRPGEPAAGAGVQETVRLAAGEKPEHTGGEDKEEAGGEDKEGAGGEDKDGAV